MKCFIDFRKTNEFYIELSFYQDWLQNDASTKRKYNITEEKIDYESFAYASKTKKRKI